MADDQTPDWAQDTPAPPAVSAAPPTDATPDWAQDTPPAAPTAIGREAAARRSLAQGSPDQAAWGSDVVNVQPQKPLTAAQIGEEYKQAGIGGLEDIAGKTIGLGLAGDIESAGRMLVHPFVPSVGTKTTLPTSAEGGYLGPEHMNQIDPSANPERAAGAFIADVLTGPKVGEVLKGVAGAASPAVRGALGAASKPNPWTDVGPPPGGAAAAPVPEAAPPAPPAPTEPTLPQAPKLTTPRVDPRGQTLSPDLLPPETPHNLPASASAGAATVSPLDGLDPQAIEDAHQALKEAGFTPYTLEQALDEQSPHHFAFELGGPDSAPFRSANGVVQVGGEGSQDISNAMGQRNVEAGQRLNGILDEALGTNNDLATIKRAERIDQLKTSDPLYKQFESLRIQPTDAIKALLTSPGEGIPAPLAAAKVFGRAREFAGLQGVPWNQNFFTTGPQKAFPTAQSWQLIKEALDSRIEDSLGPFGQATKRTALLMDIRGRLIDALDNHPDPNVAGVWKAARDNYASYSALKNARDLGQKILTEKMDPNELRYLIAGYSKPQLAALRQSVRSKIGLDAGRAGSKPWQIVNKLLGENNQDKLQQIIGDDPKSDQFFQSLAHEQEMNTNKNSLSTARINSSTSRNQIDAAKRSAPPNTLVDRLSTAASFVRHPVRAVTGHGLEKASEILAKSQQARMDKINADLAKIWTMQGPESKVVLPWILENGEDWSRRTNRARGGAVRGEQQIGSSTGNSNHSGAGGGSAFATGGAVQGLADGGDPDDTPAPAPDATDPDVAAWQQSVDPTSGVPRLTIRPAPTQTPPPEETPPHPSPSADNTDENAPIGGPTPEHRGVIDKLLGLSGPRYQTWPERMVRSGVSLGHDVMTDPMLTNTLRREDLTDIPVTQDTPREGGIPGLRDYFTPVQAEPQDPLIERTQDMAGMAGGAGAGAAEEGAVGMAGGRLLTPAVKFKGKVYTGPDHETILNNSLGLTEDQVEQEIMAPPGAAQTDVGFVNHKGHFLDRQQASQYALDNGLVAPGFENIARRGGLSSEMLLSDTQKPGAALAGLENQPFYSAMEKAVQNAPLNKATPDQWMGYLKNQPGVKAEELDQIGAPQGAGSITKDQMLQHVGQNKVQLQEKELSGTPRDEDYIEDEILDHLNDQGIRHPSNAQYAQARAEVEAKFKPGSPTRYNEYQLPGGENYRELLMKLPRKSATQEDIAAGLARTDENGNPVVGDAFQTNHWPDDPNTLLHMRMNDRDIPGVGKSLHLEELQSDWGQRGRKYGYDDPVARAAATKKLNDAGYPISNEDAQLAMRDGVLTPQEAKAIVNGGTPNMPFKTSWPELGLKRAIVKAAKEGYDSISWTPGQQQADRYDLSQHVKEIEYYPVGGNSPGSVGGETKYALGIVDKNGQAHDLPKDSYTAKELEDVVGKEIAQKIVNGEGKHYRGHDGKTLEGLDLKVGGEGMKGFYDKMLPNIANKLGKKYGAQVEYKDMPVDDSKNFVDVDRDPETGLPLNAKGKHNIKVPVLRLTPQLKEQALKGLPLFSDTQKPGAALAGLENAPKSLQDSRIYKNLLKLPGGRKTVSGWQQHFNSTDKSYGAPAIVYASEHAGDKRYDFWDTPLSRTQLLQKISDRWSKAEKAAQNIELVKQKRTDMDVWNAKQDGRRFKDDDNDYFRDLDGATEQEAKSNFVQELVNNPKTIKQLLSGKNTTSKEQDALGNSLTSADEEYLDRWHGGGEGDPTLKKSNAFTKVLDKFPTYKGTVYRGLTLPGTRVGDLVPGKVFELGGHASSSKSMGVGRQYESAGRYNTRTLWKIEQQSGRDTTVLHGSGGEQEVVLPRGTKYQITKVSPHPNYKGGAYMVEAKEVPASTKVPADQKSLLSDTQKPGAALSALEKGPIAGGKISRQLGLSKEEARQIQSWKAGRREFNDLKNSAAFGKTIQKLPKYEGPVYRGIPNPDKSQFKNAKVGDTITLKRHAPSSSSQRVVRGEFIDAYGAFLKFEQKSGRAIPDSFGYGEKEVILPKGTRYKVTNIRDSRTYWGAPYKTIELREVR